MYIFDSSAFGALGNFYPSVVPTIWDIVNGQVASGEFISVREVYRELDQKCHEEHLQDWIVANKHIFLRPSIEECDFVKELLKKEQCRNLIRYENILKGTPVADPFLIAAGKIKSGSVVTQEKVKTGSAARIPNICASHGIECINLEEFLKRSGVKL